MNSIVVTSTKQNIKFGYEGEDNVTKIIFPYDKSWLEYGEGNFEVRILRCGDEVAYTATEIVDDRQAMTLTMTVTDIELSVRGRGEMQLCYVCPDSIKKSPIYQYTVNRSVDYKYAVDPPEGSIIASVEKSLSEIKNTTNRLSNSVISIESSINDVNSQIDNINDKISEFDEEIDSIGEVETRVDNLETSVQSISGRINTAEGNINENTESISNLNESVTELENRKVTDLETSGGASDSGKYLTVDANGKVKATSLTIPTITVDASLSTTSTNPVQNKVIKTELNNINSNIATCNTEISKINESLGDVKADLADVVNHPVKSAEQLISDKRTVDKVPYKYRASASGKSDRAYDTIEGGTVCFNQLCNGTSVDTVSGRKYLTKIGGTWSVVTGAGTAITGLTSGTDMVMDLTGMFGTKIADHIYNLEQSQAGAGVALFRAMFPNNYYPFNPGELISVAGLSAHEAVGFNQWDEVYEAYGASQIRSKNKIHLLPGVTYYAKTPSVGISLYFKAQINDASNVGSISVTNNTFIVPANAHYAVLYANKGYGTDYKNDICINISSDKNGQYEPYHKTIYPLDSSLTLRGIPVLKDGKMEFDGDTYASDGTVTRRYGIVDLGTLDWVYSASPNEGFYCDNIGTKIPQTTAQKFVGICPIYANRSYNEVFAKTYDKSIAVRTNGGLRIYDSAYTDATTFKAAMSGVMLVYELAIPTTEETTPYTNPQVVSPYGTEEYVSTSICPVGHITEYPDNLKAKIDGLPWDLSMIAPVEVTHTATRNYTVNQLLIVDNTLYKVTANIANGGTITVGTNVISTTLSEVIASLS